LRLKSAIHLALVVVGGHGMNAAVPLSILNELRLALNARGVRFVHWKSNSHLALALHGETDLDLFVLKSDREQFRNILGSVRALKVISRSWGSYPDIEDWLIFDDATGKIAHLHIHYALLTGLKRVKHLKLPWDKQMIQHARPDSEFGWPIPAAEVEILTLLVRLWAKMPPWRMYFRPYIPEHIWKELLWLRRQIDASRLNSMLVEMFPEPTEIVLSGLLKEMPERSAIVSLAKQLYGQLRPNFRIGWLRACILATNLNLRFLLMRLLKRRGWAVRFGKSVARSGAMIAIIGSDGAGKSSLVRALAKWLSPKLDVHVLYLGAGDGNTGWFNSSRRALSRVFGRKGGMTVSPASAVGKDTSVAGQSTGLADRIYRLFHLQLMARKLRLLRRGVKLARAGSVVLTDRFPQHQVYGISDGPRLQNGRGFDWASKREMLMYREAAILGPNLVIKLRVSPSVAHARKPDHVFSKMAEKSAVVESLRYEQSTMVEVDADLPFNMVEAEAKAAIWRHLLIGGKADNEK
jgi:thymidylate kinase